MWLESHGNLARHPKTRRLMQRMGWSLPHTIGNLHLLWWWALDFAPDGDLSRFEPEQLTCDLDLGGATPEEFIEAMIHAGFIDRSDAKSRRLHDWSDYKRPKPRQTAAVRRNDPPDFINSTSKSFAPSDAETHSGGAQSPNEAAEKAPSSDTVSEPDAICSAAPIEAFTRNTSSAQDDVVVVPRALANQPSFTDVWWPKFLDIHEANGEPLSADAQRKLLAGLASNPFFAVQRLRTRITDAANANARTQPINTS